MTEPDLRRYERRATGATHSFRLSPRASEIMDTHPAIRPGKGRKNKSLWASRSIQWFFDSPLLQKERVPETGDFTGKYVVAHQGAPHPIDLFLQIEKLEKQVQDLERAREIAESEANHPPPGGGLRGILAQIWPFSI